jgi:putative heme iron utilization protein
MTQNIETKARKLLLSSDVGTLSTHSADCLGYPFASIVPVSFDEFNRPIILISHLAQHTRNIGENSKVSLFVNDAHQRGYEDAQTCGRITLLARAQRLDIEVDADAIARYCCFYQNAESYYKELNFHFYRLVPEKIRFIAGFGQIHWVALDPLFTKNPLSFDIEKNIIEHMNTDHRDALVKYCHQAGLVLPKNVEPEMVGVDANGFFQRIGQRIIRFEFSRPIENENDVRNRLMAMLKF